MKFCDSLAAFVIFIDLVVDLVLFNSHFCRCSDKGTITLFYSIDCMQ